MIIFNLSTYLLPTMHQELNGLQKIKHILTNQKKIRASALRETQCIYFRNVDATFLKSMYYLSLK